MRAAAVILFFFRLIERGFRPKMNTGLLLCLNSNRKFIFLHGKHPLFFARLSENDVVKFQNFNGKLSYYLES